MHILSNGAPGGRPSLRASTQVSANQSRNDFPCFCSYDMAAMTLSMTRPLRVATPARPSVTMRPRIVAPQRLVAMKAEPASKSAVETAIDNAKETCESGSTGECAAAWDEVEEISAHISHQKEAKKSSDPLEVRRLSWRPQACQQCLEGPFVAPWCP